MSEPISILECKRIIQFNKGLYSLMILGGWNVKTNNFSLIFREVGEINEIKPKEKLIRTQSFEFGLRAKEIATIEISKSAKYEIVFFNTESLEVKKSNLISISFFQNYISVSNIQLYIKRII